MTGRPERIVGADLLDDDAAGAVGDGSASGEQGSGMVSTIIGTALLMSSLNASAISVGLPSMAHDLGVAPLRLNVVLTAYVLSQMAFLPTSAWLADRFGAKSMLQLAILLFAVASLACGLAQSLPALVLRTHGARLRGRHDLAGRTADPASLHAETPAD